MAIPTYPLKIKQIIKEATDSVSFIFEVPTEHKALFYYRPAQFLTFEFVLQGQHFLRSYSISSCPLLQEPLKTTVKRVKGGVISNYMIDHLKVGDTLASRKPAGRFFKAPADLKPKCYFLFAGGSGITPLFSILKTALLSDPANKVTLFYANRDKPSVIYLKELNDWLSRYPKPFHIISILSQPRDGEDTKFPSSLSKVIPSQAKGLTRYIKGRLQKSHLEEYFSSMTPLDLQTKNHLYYLCGPAGFMDTVQSFLLEKQVEKKQIRKESFLPVAPVSRGLQRRNPPRGRILNEAPVSDRDAQPSLEAPPLSPLTKWGLSGDSAGELCIKGQEGESKRATPEMIKALINEEKISIHSEINTPILEQLLSAGHSPPFSCLSGSCMSCLAVLKKGQIIQEERGILEDENIKNHEILTCQAKPVSRIVEVDYDNVST